MKVKVSERGRKNLRFQKIEQWKRKEKNDKRTSVAVNVRKPSASDGGKEGRERKLSIFNSQNIHSRKRKENEMTSLTRN